MDTELIAGVLRQHRTVDAGRRVPGKPGLYVWRFECRCGWESDGFAPGNLPAEEAAETAALMHEAERIVEALRVAAPDVLGADTTTLDDAPHQPVPATNEG